MRLAWIGLGSIGTHMALRAAAAGHAVTAYARGMGQDALAAGGAVLCPSYLDTAACCDLLGVCVFDDRQVRQVLLESGVLRAMKPGSVVAIHTTGSPSFMRELAQLAPPGVAILDATFSGAADQAQAGSLTLVVGGKADALAFARPVFDAYAIRIHHVGPTGAGQTLKLLNNVLFAANLRLAHSALSIAGQQGFDPGEAARVLQACSGMSAALGLFTETDPAVVLAAAGPYLEKDVAAAGMAADAAGIDLGLLLQVAQST